MKTEFTCKTCDAEDSLQPFEVKFKMPATHLAYPSLTKGGYSKEPWPVCGNHTNYAMIAGWKLEEIPLPLEDE